MSRELLLKFVFGGDAAGATKAANDAKSAVDRLGDAIKKPIGKSGAEAALDAIKPKAEQAGQAVKLSTQQLGQMQFQLQDIAVGLTSGQSPFTVMMQQGSQISQMFGSGTGVLGALKAVGQGITQFLTNPLNLAVLGFGVATTAIGAMWSAVRDGDGANNVIERHEELVKRIGDAYDGATGKLKAFSAETQLLLRFEAQRDQYNLARELRSQQSDLISTVRGNYVVGGVAVPNRTDPGFRDLNEAVADLRQKLSEGKGDIKSFADQIVRIGLYAGEGSEAGKVAHQIIDVNKGLIELSTQYNEAKALVDGLAGSTNQLNTALGRATGNMKYFAESVGTGNSGTSSSRYQQPFNAKTILDLIAQAEGTASRRNYNETLGYGRFSGGDKNLVTMTLSEILSLQKQMLANPANTFNSSALGRYQITRQTLQDFMPRLGLSGDTIFSPAVQDKLALAIIKASGGDAAGVQRRWQGAQRVSAAQITSVLNTSSGDLAGAAQDMQDAQASATKKANAEKQKQIEIERRWAEVMRQGNDGLESRNSVLGRSTLETARAAKEQQLLNQAHQIFGETIPAAEMAKIKAMAQSYGELAAATKQAAEAQKEQAAQSKNSIEALDETRSMFGGLASDFLRAREEGKSWGDSFSSVLDKLKEKAFSLIDKLIDNALFGQQGTQNGGLLGGLLTTMMAGLTAGGISAGSTLYANGGAFAGGLQAFAQGDVFHRPTLFRYGRDKMGVMGEAGPEAVMPLFARGGKLGVGVATAMGEGHLPLARLGSGRLGVKAFAAGDVFGGAMPRGASASGPAMTVNHTVHNHAPVQVESKSKRNAQGGIDIETTVKQIVDKHFASGDADRVLMGRYGVSRKLDRVG